VARESFEVLNSQDGALNENERYAKKIIWRRIHATL
jgi:hypothetical protein